MPSSTNQYNACEENMLSDEEKAKVQAEIAEKQKELDALKETLKTLHTEKEAAFEKRRKVSGDINSLSKNIRDAKGKRNSFTKQVREAKTRRDELNSQIKAKVQELKKLQAERGNITQRFGIRIDPARIRQEIEDLEFKIETEALPFHIEQRLMKQITEKKRLLESAQDATGIFDKVHECQKELRKLRKKADEAHKKTQVKAGASQEQHEELVETSKEVKDLRDREEETLKLFVEAKNKWIEQSDKVKAKQDEIRSLREKIGETFKEEKEKQKKQDAIKIAETKKDVEEKIKKKMKLTTEDFLAFQAEDMKPRGKRK
ncbi:TPA: hypothetical protein HA265_07555 [Candidatus Woesearchaeota archaeon]|nr:hypothetical protein [Candidatus Woesearchaeota archaeon]